MAITRPKQPQVASVDAFIGAAPDAARGVQKGRKRQISITVSPDTLVGIDALARELGMSRAAVFNLALVQLLKHGLSIEAGEK
ncbi:MAG: ribbon-helix-helix domain-containing protein [Azoarcus sp.]|jgi:hypothetical protein|nr:ribbon-helix-helix domain-containing protein [Azoarcus sp.]